MLQNLHLRFSPSQTVPLLCLYCPTGEKLCHVGIPLPGKEWNKSLTWKSRSTNLHLVPWPMSWESSNQSGAGLLEIRQLIAMRLNSTWSLGKSIQEFVLALLMAVKSHAQRQCKWVAAAGQKPSRWRILVCKRNMEEAEDYFLLSWGFRGIVAHSLMGRGHCVWLW